MATSQMIKVLQHLRIGRVDGRTTPAVLVYLYAVRVAVPGERILALENAFCGRPPDVDRDLRPGCVANDDSSASAGRHVEFVSAHGEDNLLNPAVPQSFYQVHSQ